MRIIIPLVFVIVGIVLFFGWPRYQPIKLSVDTDPAPPTCAGKKSEPVPEMAIIIPPSPLPLPSRAEIVRLLKVEADTRQVYWRVWCTAFYEGDKEEFMGIATKGKEFNLYIEDNAPDYWQVQNFSTQDEAAFALLIALRGAPNQKPMHKDERKRTECVPPLTGAPHK